MKDFSKAGFGTKAIHAGVEPDPTTGAIMTPIFQTSTYAQERLGEIKGYEYSRTGNPTRHALENAIAALEGARFGACFGSGLAATDCVIKMLNPGDEVITTNDLYGGTYRIFRTIFEKYGIKFHFVNMNNSADLESVINANTKLIWAETPTNPLLNIIDIEAVSKIAKKHNVLVAVDNTFASPYNQNPIHLGADIVVHSVTKYLGGHSDVVMGAVITDNEDLAKEIYRIQNSSGGVTAPMDSFLVLRGIKTLHLRMERHAANGEKIAHFLKNHPKVEKVYWPGFEEHPNHEVAKRQMRTYGGMVSFVIKGGTVDDAKKVMNKFHVFTIAESLGGVESLACHPTTMTHAAIPEKERKAAGIVDSLVRLSVGVENVEDLIADLEQALN